MVKAKRTRSEACSTSIENTSGSTLENLNASTANTTTGSTLDSSTGPNSENLSGSTLESTSGSTLENTSGSSEDPNSLDFSEILSDISEKMGDEGASGRGGKHVQIFRFMN